MDSVDGDPFGLRAGLKNDSELMALRQRGRKGRKIERFQRGQNKLIEALLKPMDKHTSDAQEVAEASRLGVKIALYSSLGANLALCVVQLYAAISSGSLSLLETGIDSVFDIFSSGLLFWLHRKAQRLDVKEWPVGGSRLETIGNVLFGFLMTAVNLIVVVESTRVAITHDKESDVNDFHLEALVAVAAALGVKFLLFIVCHFFRKQSSQIEMLWEDHRNDLPMNTFGILMSAGGSKLRWWLDPLGAIIIATAIILSWTRTLYRQFGLLAGRSAPHDFIQLVIYKALMFHKDFDAIDTVRAYHSGPNYFVEVDVVMSRDTPLWKAHDVSQQLQDKLEVLPNVGRAFVHVDHETSHHPEHQRVYEKEKRAPSP
ncbi:CDF manganese transporter [Auricularia subglabra TFB-10046 SS5]|uniref:CDF manganese transporter n=1 Tax=Auricularia subglabra (strain TFB-10046 / SS5) TaxID=717982 RepID=J0DB88_AURST|nr:CDF manganese transporter [Auricularia subglabra TFB-10046 SS5]